MTEYKQVGWYCAGGHYTGMGKTANPSIRMDDPCAFGVPVYIEVAPEHVRGCDLAPGHTGNCSVPLIAEEG